jgi:two-component system response regulator
MTTQKEIRVLLVEDNRDDIDLTLMAFRMNGTPVAVDVAHDGAEALDYLFSTGSRSGQAQPSPSVVLLDLKLPRINGIEVLRRMRSDERTRRIPVVVLTTSAEQRDLQQIGEIGVERYVRKPVNFTEFRETARQLAETWLIPGTDRKEVPA